MPATKSNPSSRAADDDFFNDLSRRAPDANDPESPQNASNENAEGGLGEAAARPKRIACVLCRKRKLKCDGSKPSCGTCSRLGHDCAYDEVRKKSGPKRGYVKLLEARLKQVENLLGTRDGDDTARSVDSIPNASKEVPFARVGSVSFSSSMNNPLPEPMAAPVFPDTSMDAMMPDLDMGGMGSTEEFPWEMISLGLEEPLPEQEVIDDLNRIFFEKIHPSLPMIHRPRFLAAMDLAPHMRPPVCLRYAMWAQVASITTRYSELQDHFYTRARKYAEQDEMRAHGESMITLAHAQCWMLLCSLEFKMMYFPRAWMSCGRATRLTQMMGLHRQDGVGLDVKQCLPPPRDWTEREERRRTFWMAFCNDRYASIGTGWPMTVDERDILTNLPASEEAFDKSKPEPTSSLAEAMTANGAASLSAFGGVVLMACLFGRNLTHLHRPHENDRDDDLNGEFWKRHRALDNILVNTALSLPQHLRLPAGLMNSNVVYLNMNIHTSTICLHQAAIFKADKNRMPAQIGAESKRRCIIAADQISNLMKSISHVDLSTMNPFIAFCLYVAARVFVQYLKSKKDDTAVKSSLEFLLSAMHALKSKNPLTESFLVQLDVDLEGSGLELPNATKLPATKRAFREIPVNTDSVSCSPLYEIRESQSIGQNGLDQRPLRTTDDMPMEFNTIHPETQNLSFNGSSLPQRAKTSAQTVRSPNDIMSALFGDQGSLPDTGLSPDTSSSDRRSRQTSDHLTPSSSSNKGSSMSSFTPPQFDDTSHASYPSTATHMSPNTAARVLNQNADVYSQYANRDGPVGMSQTFAIPSQWDYPAGDSPNPATGLADHIQENLAGGTGMTPGATGTGMTPGPSGMTPMMSESGWQNMNILDGNEWMLNWQAPTPQP